MHRQNREAMSGKTRGGVCLFVNNSWCAMSNIKEVSRYCSPVVEYLMITCRPHYLPSESTFYIQPSIYHHKPMLALRPYSMCGSLYKAISISFWKMHIQKGHSQWPGTLMQANLNLFYLISTSMSNVQPEEKPEEKKRHIQSSPSTSIWQICQ